MKRFRKVALALVIAAAAPSLIFAREDRAHADAAAATNKDAPHRHAHTLDFTVHGHATTPVVVNGAGPYAFIVDTAASAATISGSLSSQLALAPFPGQARVQGGTGSARTQIFIIDSLIVAGSETRAAPAARLDRVQSDYDAAGIVGADVLAKGVLHLDLPDRRIAFAERGDVGDAKGAGWSAIPIRLNEVHFVLMPIEIEGEKLVALLDTGARRSILNWPAVHALGLGESSPRLTEGTPIEGATAEKIPAREMTAASIAAGDVSWQARPLTVANLPVFKPLGLSTEPAMILGLDLLRELRLVIDYDGQTLYLRRPD